MVALQQYLISARFVTTLCHLVSLLLLFATVKNNIETSLSDTADHEDRLRAQHTAWSALVIGFLCFLLDLNAMFSGSSLFINKGNIFHILLHFVGGILLSWAVTYQWSYKALWPIVLVCSVPTALYEIGMLAAQRLGVAV